jgi:trimeric autotransporter adhesin
MMLRAHSAWRRLCSRLLLCCGLLIVLGLPVHSANAGVPITLYRSMAGYLNITATGGTLRAQSNAGNACALNSSSTALLNSIPAGATVAAAYLYWGGSGSTPDNNVTLNGASLGADRTFTETFNYGGTNYDFFGGFKDVTSLVAATGNASYTFANLSVNNGSPHCAVEAVVSGWSLLVVYQKASEPLRMVNIYDGLQFFRGGEITLNPANFTIPSSGMDGKLGILTWEGDVENSSSLNGYDEALTYNGTALTDSYNPADNQFNSTINVLGSSTSYGVDFDSYDVSALLAPGATSATTVYSSGADLVLLGMEVLSVTNTPLDDLAISMTHSGNFTAGQNGSFTLHVNNSGPSTETGTITVTDTLPAGLGFVSGAGSGWSCAATGQTVSCSHAGPLAGAASLPDLTLTVSVAAGAAPGVTNTAMVSGSVFDFQSGNNSSTDTVVVKQPDLSTSTKSVVDLNGGDANPGDTLRYTIALTESAGVPASGISVTDNLPANTTSLLVVSVPAGAVDNSTGTQLSVSGLSLPASGNDSIVFDVTISGSTPPGTAINNTATVTNPFGPGATPAAPPVTVSASQVAASGNKPLYLWSNTLSRSVPSPTGSISIGERASSSWTLSPALAKALVVNGSSGYIPVTLQLGESGSGSSRSYTIQLSSSALGTLATLSLNNVDLNPAISASYNLPLGAPGDKLLPAGSTLTLTITNNTTGSGSRNLVVNPNGSFVNLPSKTVINVDSAGFYSAAWPGGTLITTATPGTTVRVRAVVSDPFGSFDITSTTLTLIDPAGTTRVSGAAMTLVADSGTSTRTYEYAYTIPAAAANGTWTAKVLAHEGSEGMITHQRNVTLVTGAASLALVKSVQTLSDPVHGTGNPYNIPGAVLLYTIQVSNSGAGSTDADTVAVVDAIPAHTALQVTDIAGGGSGPVLFIDGSPSSGLSYSYTSPGSASDGLDFSVDGVNWTYVPTADANGADAAVRYLRVRPTHAMAAAGASGNPSFQLRFKVVVQ